jgi:hypothetical protein
MGCSGRVTDDHSLICCQILAGLGAANVLAHVHIKSHSVKKSHNDSKRACFNYICFNPEECQRKDDRAFNVG